MKKFLSALLTLALALSLAVCAFAAKEPPPAVTGIEAVWNGEALFQSEFLWPDFNAKNVTVTLHYADGTSEALTRWCHEDDDDRGWEVLFTYDPDKEADKVTIYYQDSYLNAEYWDSHEEWDYGDWLATLPQASFTVPTNLWAIYLSSQPKTELWLEESKKASVAEGDRNIFVFTPAENRLYYFYSENLKKGNPFAILTEADFPILGGNDNLFDSNFGFINELQAGRTYYLTVSGSILHDAEFDVAVSSDVRKLSGLQWVGELLSGGLFTRRWVQRHLSDDDDITVCSLPGKGTWIDNAKYNLKWIKDCLFPPPIVVY